MNTLYMQKSRACPLLKIVKKRRVILDLSVENTSILSIRKPQFDCYKLRFSGLCDMY